MAPVTAVKKNRKNRGKKISLVFDEEKRRDFLTGFHKRKLQRKKDAKAKFERNLKEERKRLKTEAKESYKKLVVSHRAIPELENLLTEQYEDEDVTVKVIELSTNDIARQNNWIGANQPKYENESESESEEAEHNAEQVEEVPGMELKPKKKVVEDKVVAKQQFNSEKDLKRLLKKEATKKVKTSKVFQRKNKLEKQKQKKNSFHLKKQKTKMKEKQTKRKH